MRMFREILAGLLALLIVVPVSPVAAQTHSVDRSALAAAVSAHVAKQDADRATIKSVLTSPQVRDVAEKTGVDVDRLAASVETLSGDGLAQAAAAASRVNDSLVGGDNIVISTTTLIIVLLVVLLIVVAAK